MCILRKAKPNEEKEIFELVETVLKEYGIKTNAAETDKDLSDLDMFYFNNNGCFEVLVDNGRVIGSYGIYCIDNMTCELRKMYLMPTYQGKGLGKRMLDEAIKKAKAFGYSQMTLESNKILDKALGLYKKYGFEEYTPDHYSDRCNLAMKLKL